MNRASSPMCQGRGRAICSGSTSSAEWGLGKIVQQIVGQDLDRIMAGRHEGAGTQDAKHVAEIGAGPMRTYEDVGKHLAAFQHAFFQHQQALSSRMMSAASLAMSRRYRPKCPRRRCAGRRVVDASPRKPTTCPLLCKARIHRCCAPARAVQRAWRCRPLRQLGVRHGFHLPAQQHAVRR